METIFRQSHLFCAWQMQHTADMDSVGATQNTETLDNTRGYGGGTERQDRTTRGDGTRLVGNAERLLARGKRNDELHD